MNRYKGIDPRSTLLLRLVGYGLLTLALFDVISIFFPAYFTDPNWEFQMLGELVEKVPVPLLGIMLVLFGEESFRQKPERLLVKILSWLTLVVGLLFLLLFPLGVLDTGRINDRNTAQINNQVLTQLAQLQQFKTQIEQATTEAAINNLARQANPQALLPEMNSQALKNKLLSDLAAAQARIQAEAETTRKSQQLTLLKRSVKWNLGAVVAAVLFISIWRMTSWARR
jgi:hypothetical protein